MRGIFKHKSDKSLSSLFLNAVLKGMTYLFFKSLFIICVFLSSFIDLAAQSPHKIMVKAGGYLVFNHGFKGYSLCFETEKHLKASLFFSSGIRLDYVHIPYQEAYSGHLIALGAGYEFKYYPIRNKNGFLMDGPFVGLYPYYYLPINKTYRYGPGAGINVGYQQRIGERFALSAELNMIYMQNFNEQVPIGNPDDRYFNFLPLLKVGIRF